jgi:hypothetical protein
VQLGQLPTDLLFGTAPSSKEKAIMGAVAPKPPLSTHPQSKLLGFLAFSHDVSFSKRACTKYNCTEKSANARMVFFQCWLLSSVDSNLY